MQYKWIGALLIMAGCGAFGFSLAASHCRREQSLKKLIRILEYMACELQFRLTPLPELCLSAAEDHGGVLGCFFCRLGEELRTGIRDSVPACVDTALEAVPELTEECVKNLRLLGESLGRFDLEGQLKGLESVRTSCRRELEEIQRDRDTRMKSYQTLSLCAGAALAILLV